VGVKREEDMSGMIMIMQRLGGFITGGQVDSRRNNFYVEKGFQRSFALFFALVVLVLIIASGASFYVFLGNILEQNIYTIHPRVRNLSEAITPELIQFFVEVTFAAIIIIFIAADRFLNRITKSLMDYERQAKRLAKLDFKKVNPLENDRFFSLQSKYDGLTEKYSNDILLLREKVARMGQLIKLLDEDAGLPKEKRIALVKELGELKEVLDAKMREYKLGRE